MNRIEDNIKDDELRVLGKPNHVKSELRAFKWYHAALLGWVLVVVIVSLVLFFYEKANQVAPDFYDASSSEIACAKTELPAKEKLGDYTDSLKAYTEHLQLTINDIPLDIYIPHNAKPRLFIGTPDLNDTNIIFTTQAADIRADNGKINGAFVLAGEPKAWGLSKKGYCGIVDGAITVGVASNSPIFEEATERNGYFFRQYPLVDNGHLVENEPKGKSIRKCICERGGEIVIVMTSQPESFHDFAQALVDFGADNAIYLVGGTSYGYFRDKCDNLTIITERQKVARRYENHIQWTVE